MLITQQMACKMCGRTSLIPVRLVSHHLRLLGLLHREDSQSTLVLVDYDDTKGT